MYALEGKRCSAASRTRARHVGSDVKSVAKTVAGRTPPRNFADGSSAPGCRSANSSAEPGESNNWAAHAMPRCETAVIDVRTASAAKVAAFIVTQTRGQQVDVPQPEQVDRVLVMCDPVDAGEEERVNG